MSGDEADHRSGSAPGREAFTIVVAIGFIVVVLAAAIWALAEASW